MFVLAGGPGDAATQFFAWLPSVLKEVHSKRDIVMVDQRGTGDSNRLTLPEMPDTTRAVCSGRRRPPRRLVRDALASIDADPRFYTTSAAADDLDEVKAALGYEKVNLYGTSYGGTVVQYYLRQHGNRVRAAVLDGSTPLDVPVLELIGRSSQAALDLLMRRCVEDATCQAAFPRLDDETTSTRGCSARRGTRTGTPSSSRSSPPRSASSADRSFSTPSPCSAGGSSTPVRQ